MNTSETTINRADIAICITKDGQTYADYPNLELKHFDKLLMFIEDYLIQATLISGDELYPPGYGPRSKEKGNNERNRRASSRGNREIKIKPWTSETYNARRLF